jgi:hypothetical protein
MFKRKNPGKLTVRYVPKLADEIRFVNVGYNHGMTLC